MILAGARMDSLCWNIASAFKAGTAGEFAFPEQYRKSAEDCYTEWRAAKREYDRLSHQQPAPVSEGPRYSFGPDKSWVQADLSRDPGYWTAPVSEPAYTKADDLLHTIGGVEHPDAASGEGLPEPFGFYDADEGTFCRFAEGADPHLLDDYPEITYLYSRAQIIEARRLATTGQGDVERLVERIRNIPVPERGFHEGWRDEEIWQWALREAAVVTAMTLAPFGQQQEGQG